MILARIQSLLPELRPSERRVAEIVLARPTLTAGASIRMIAAAAEASEPTVMRFCRAIGCVGVQDLKRQIARDLGRFTPARFSEATPAEPFAFLGQQTLDHAFETLFEMRKLIPDAGYARAVDLMAAGRGLLFWGLGDYRGLAEDAKLSCVRAGGVAEAGCEIPIIEQQADVTGEGICIVALALRSLSEDLEIPMRAARCAKARGARLIVLGPSTDAQSPDSLAGLADCCVPVVTNATPDWLGLRLALHILLGGWAFEQQRSSVFRQASGS